MSHFVTWLLDARLHVTLAVFLGASIIGSGRWVSPDPLELPVIHSRFSDNVVVIYPDGSTSRQFARHFPAWEELESDALAAE